MRILFEQLGELLGGAGDAQADDHAARDQDLRDSGSGDAGPGR